MSPSTRFIIKRIAFQRLLPVLIAIAMALFPLFVSADEDSCRETGIVVGRQNMRRNLWYTRNGGPCTRWTRHHLLTIKPEDALIVYRDMNCKTEYCPMNLSYDVFKSLDSNQNCRVRILPDCTLSDI